MSEKSSEKKRGLNIVEAILGCAFGLGGFVWLIGSPPTSKTLLELQIHYEWWVYLVYLLLLHSALQIGLQSLVSVSLRFRGVPKIEWLAYEEKFVETYVAIVARAAVAAALLVRLFFWDSAVVVSRRFGIDESLIFMSPRPHDCEFMSAPLGLKHCSYKANYRLSSDGLVYQEWARYTE